MQGLLEAPLDQNNVFQRLPEPLENFFRDAWTCHADVVSKLYSGTGALKTDFTRTGKRTYKGAINDGINSLTRYYLNNFRDGNKQDSLDMFLGKLENEKFLAANRKSGILA